MNIRIIQATVVLFLNNAFLLLAVADPKLLKFSLIGGLVAFSDCGYLSC